MSNRNVPALMRNPTAGYQAAGIGGIFGLQYVLQGEPWFNWGHVPQMITDNAVSMGLRALRSPFSKITIAKDPQGQMRISGRPEVRKFIAKTWKKFWKSSLLRLLDYYFKWGRCAGGAEWEYNPATRRLELTRVRAVEPFDATPFTWKRGKRRGELAGFLLRRGAENHTRWVGAGNAFFFGGYEALGPFVDMPRIATAFAPWLEKNSPQGLRQARRVEHFTRAVGITVIRYPKGTSQRPDGSFINNENLAVQLGLSLQNGTVTAIEDAIVPGTDKWKWDIDQRRSPGDGGKINDAIKDADEEIWFGMGIPPEILRAGGAAGSGYSGRAIPMEIWLAGADELAGMVDEPFRRDVLHYGVRQNFGRTEWDYELSSLLDEYLETQKGQTGTQLPPGAGEMGGGGGAPGGSNPWQPDGTSSRGTPRELNPATGRRRYLASDISDDMIYRSEAMAKYYSGTPTYLSDLPEEDDDAANPEHLRALRYALYVLAELGAVHGFDAQPGLDSLTDLSHDPDGLARILGSADLSWIPYQGPRGGVGARSDVSGRIIYGIRAKAALEAQARRGQRQSSADRARQLTDDVHAGRVKDDPAHFEELATHLPALNVAELRDARRKLRATFQNGTRRDQMVKALLEHSKAVQEGIDPPKRKAGGRPFEKTTGEPENPHPGKVYDVPTDKLEVDPERFQFKLNTDESGVTKELKSVKTFNPEFAGVLAAWKDPEDGKSYVVNGHHRHELASRTGHPSLPVRYIQAGTAKEARAVGALINMAEGRGTAVDAAKFMRDSNVGPEELEKRGVSLHGRLAEDASALRSLSDKTFDKLARGDLDTAKALAVAKNLPAPELQDQLFKLLDKREEAGKDLPLKVIEEMAREMSETPTHTTTESTLFGDIEDEQRLYVPRNELKAAVRNDLARELGDFSAVASTRRAGAVGAAGNVLNLEENKKRAAEAADAKWTFDQLANRSGAISTALNEGAAEYVKAKSKGARDDVRKRTADKVREAIRAEAAGLRKPDAGGVGGGDEGSVTAPGGIGGDAADQGAGDAGTGGAVGAGVDELRGKVQANKRGLKEVIAGAKPVGVEGRGGKDMEEAKAAGLHVAELTGPHVPSLKVYARTPEDVKPLADYIAGGGKYGTPEFSRHLGYSPEEIETYKQYLAADGQHDLLNHDEGRKPPDDPAAHLGKLRAAMKPGEWMDRDAAAQLLDSDANAKTGNVANLGKLAALHEAGHVELEGGRVRLKPETITPDPETKAGAGETEPAATASVPKPEGNEGSSGWWHRMTPDQQRAAMATLDKSAYSATRQKLIEDAPGKKYSHDFRRQTPIDDAWRKAREGAAASEEPKPAGGEPDKPADNVQRDLLGRAVPKKFGKSSAVQPTIEDAIRESWTQRAKEHAAEAGKPIEEYSASGRFRMGGEWYEVGKAEDGHPVTKVEPDRPATPPQAYQLDNHATAPASAEHVETVHKALRSVPDHVHASARRFGVKAGTARRVTDFLPELAGQAPRGWPAGRTWDHADGLYHPSSKTAVATEEYLDGDTPIKTSRAGGVALHEYGHGVDRAIGAELAGLDLYSKSGRFQNAYHKDVSGIPDAARKKLGYYLQSGHAGPEEVFAEAFAQIHHPEGKGASAKAGEILKHFPNCAAVIKAALEAVKE